MSAVVPRVFTMVSGKIAGPTGVRLNQRQASHDDTQRCQIDVDLGLSAAAMFVFKHMVQIHIASMEHQADSVVQVDKTYRVFNTAR